MVFKRSLVSDDPESDVQFAVGRQPIGFGVWDGEQNDRGSRKSISEWINLTIEPEGNGSGQQERCLHGGNQSGCNSFSLTSVAYGTEEKVEEIGMEPRVITVKAKQFEYMPNKISVKKGELITIRLESLDVTHGFFLDGYGVQLKARPGLVGKAIFVADKTERFTFRCSETCGEFHPYMIGFMQVTPNSRFGIFSIVIITAFGTIVGILYYRDKKGVKGNVGTDQSKQ